MNNFNLKRFLVIVCTFAQVSMLWAQTPQELKTLRERVAAFAYAQKVEQVSANEYKVALSSGDEFILCCGKGKNKAFKTINVGDDKIVTKPKKGKSFTIGRKPDQVSALIALYNGTNGKKWSNNEGWGNISLGIDAWKGITCNEQGAVTKIELKENNLQGVLPDVFYAFPELKTLALEKNQLTGVLPRSLAWLPKGSSINVQHNKLSTTTFYLPRHRLGSTSDKFKYHPQQEGYKDFRIFTDCDVDLNPVNGYHADMECHLYHKATEGPGVDIYILGDGFDKAEHAIGGTAEYWLESAADAVFKIKPYSQLKKYFNIYIIYAYSTERGVNLEGSSKDCRFGFWPHISKEKRNGKPYLKMRHIFDVCKSSTTNAGYQFKDGDTHVLLVVNSLKTRSYAIDRTFKDGDEKRVVKVGTATVRGDKFNAVIWHEFCGHTFGILHDEYIRKGVVKEYKKSSIDRVHLDLESDPAKVKWAKFIADPRYADEKLGVYQGALAGSNVYRATESSIMRSLNKKTAFFNAPSRVGIYSIVMKKVNPNWEFDYEEFVKFDMGDKYYPLPTEITNTENR